MAIIVENGTGKPDAEAYASVAGADDYVSLWYGTHDGWSAASEEEKEVALRQGARFIDARNYIGVRVSVSQNRAFPRAGMGNIDGKFYNYNEVPGPIVSANIEAAIKHIEGEDLFPDHYGQTLESESKDVGPLKKSFKYSSSKYPVKTFEAVESLVRPFLAGASTMALSRSVG